MTKILDKQNPTVAVKNEVTNIERLKEMLREEDGSIDEALLLDTIEGETNLHEMLLEIEDRIAEYDMQAKAVQLRIDDLVKRKSRYKASADTLRTTVLSAMDKAGIRKIEGSLATLSVGRKPRSLVVEDESIIPSDYFKTQLVLDKKKLIEDLKDGNSVTGACMDNGGIKLQIRRK